ncbi:MAG: GldM family protein [Flavobacteriales bacterium]
MAGGKETPRQKMIGMMYLVLTALLAMNVSKEVVDAFVTIDNNQNKSLQAIEGKLDTQLAALSSNADQSPQKYGSANQSAQEIHDEATQLIEHIDLIKAKTFSISVGNKVEDPISTEVYENGSFKIDLDSVKALVGIDNYDNNTNLMIKDAANPTEEDNADGNNYTAVVLRQKLEVYRNKVISELEKIDGTETLVENVKKNFDYPLKDDPRLKPDEEEWVVKNFYHVPLAASTAMLTGIQNKIRTAESDLVDRLYVNVEGKTYKFDELKSAVIPMATTVPAGSNYEADVFLAAYDTKNYPEIRLGKPGVKWDSLKNELSGDFDVLEMDGTVGKVKIPASGLGAQQREGMIIFRPVGLPERIEPFNIDYAVVAPQLVVSPTKMNVFYKGVPNPVTVSVPGFTDGDVVANMSGGSMRNDGGGNYTVTPGDGQKANISATVTLPDGSTQSMGPVEFRIKRIPDPEISFAGKGPTDNIIKKNALANAAGVIPMLKDFEFDIRPEIVEYTVVVVQNGQVKAAKCTARALSGDARALLGNVKAGQNFTIENVKVKVAGETRKVSSVALRVVN